MVFPPASGGSESRWLLKALREAAHELESQLWGLEEDELRWRPSDDGLSLKEIAAHLRDSEQFLVQALELLATRDDPRLPRFDADALVEDRDYRDADIYDALQEFDMLRQRTVSLLWMLEPEDWERAGRDPYRGTVTIAQLAREQNEHDLEHLWQARKIRESLAGSPSS